MEPLYLEYKDYFSKRIQSLERPIHEQILPANEEPPSQKTLQTTVCVRIRPLTEFERESNHIEGVIGHDSGIVNTYEPRRKARSKPEITKSSFTLDKVYGPEHSIEDLYSSRLSELVQWSLQGGTSMLLAYGQTGSGKTYTITELEDLLVVEMIKVQARQVKLSIFEVAGNNVFDLLNDRMPLKVLEDVLGTMQLPSIVEKTPKTSDEFRKLLDVAKALRSSASTTKNDQSSRSHSICRINIVDTASPLDIGSILLVDLAGSEASSDTSQHSKERMVETREINKSLSVLKECITKRAQWSVSKAEGSQKRIHIPFRSNKLTQVLKSAFDIDSTQTCKMVAIACIAPSILDVAHSKNTLRYAMALRVQIPDAKPAPFSEQVPTTWSNKDVRAWVLKTSGNPVINSQLLAPTENGTQMCRLGEDEFVRRCLLTAHVEPGRARLLYFKLWSLHIDSRALANQPGRPLDKVDMLRSKDKAGREADGMRRQLIKPGMFCRVKTGDTEENFDIVMALGIAGTDDQSGWVCAAVRLADVRSGAYELFIATQAILTVGKLTDEIILEYDSNTRYYYVKDIEYLD